MTVWQVVQLPEVQAGARFRRASWRPGKYWTLNASGQFQQPSGQWHGIWDTEELLAEDWELIPVLTRARLT